MEPVATEEYTAEDSLIIRMTTMEAQEKLAETVSLVAAGDERVILSQDGKDVAAIITIEEFWLLERLIAEEEERIDLEDARAALAEAKEKGTISLAALKAELGL